MENQSTIKGTERSTDAKERNGNFGDREPKLFTRVSMSKDGRWFFIDTVIRSFAHVNYMRAIDRNKLAELAKESAAPSLPQGADQSDPSGDEGVVHESQPQASKPSRKIKGTGKENDRAT